MGKKSIRFGMFFIIFLMFGGFITTHLAHSSKLLVVRSADNSLYKNFHGIGGWEGWEKISGQFTQQPTLVWDRQVGVYYLYGVGGDGQTIWQSTFDKDGNFNDDWAVFGGATPSPVAAAQGMTRQRITINCNEFVPYLDGYTWTRYYEGGALHPMDSSSSGWDAPVILPAGSIIKAVLLFTYNDGEVTDSTFFQLARSENYSTNRENLAEGTAWKNAGFGFAGDLAVNAEVDSTYSYFIRVNLPSPENWFTHVEIVYEAR